MDQRIIISKNFNKELAEAISECNHDKVFVLTDETTIKTCWPEIGSSYSLKKAQLITIPSTDTNKNLESISG